MKIIPAILPQRYRQIEEGIEQIIGVADTVQIDFVDGQFAANKTWLFNGKDEEVLGEFEREERGLPHWEELNYEFDIMVRDPLQYIDKLVMLGPSKIIFHLEGFQKDEMMNYFETLPEIVRTTISFGIAIGIGTPPEDVAPFIPFISSIQCMGISDPGFQGQQFNVDAIAQVRRAKELYPGIAISVDGGVSSASIPLLIEAGATELVVGSAIFGSGDPRGTIGELQTLCNQAFNSLSRRENSN